MRARVVAAAAAGLVLTGCADAAADRPRPTVAPAASAPGGGSAPGGTSAAASGGGLRGFRSVRGYAAAPAPVRVVIPSIRVSSTLDRLGRATDATVEVPKQWGVAGWYAAGPRPGDPGSAVILGHVDSTRGPAVFYRLHELHRGDPVVVERADGSRVTFLVQRVAQFDKRRFPTEDVYYPTLHPLLRLVTCGGEFDSRTGHYRSNVIAFAAAAAGQ